MKWLLKILDDVKKGENIDSYATITVAFVVVILNLLSITSPSLISSLTLAILGLLALTSLGNRHRIENLEQSITHNSSNFFMTEFPSEFTHNFEDCKELWLIGVNLNRTVRNHYSLLEHKLKRGDRLYFLMVSPLGTSYKIASERSYPVSSTRPERTNRLINDTLGYLCGLKTSHPEAKIEFRVIETPLTFGAVATDPDLASGVLYIEHYPYRTTNKSIPKFVLYPRDGEWYDFFRREIHVHWENAEIWDCHAQVIDSPDTKAK